MFEQGITASNNSSGSNSSSAASAIARAYGHIPKEEYHALSQGDLKAFENAKMAAEDDRTLFHTISDHERLEYERYCMGLCDKPSVVVDNMHPAMDKGDDIDAIFAEIDTEPASDVDRDYLAKFRIGREPQRPVA